MCACVRACAQALLEHRETLVVYTMRSLAAQDASGAAQQEYEAARQRARDAAAREMAALERWVESKEQEAAAKGALVSAEATWGAQAARTPAPA